MALTYPTVLAFDKKLDCSDAFFWQYDHNAPDSIIPVAIYEKSVRGTISNRQKNNTTKDPLKLNAKIQKPNLQTVDHAALDEDKDVLLVKWSCKVLPFTGSPIVCNDQEYQSALEEKVQNYIKTQGFEELARRYALNMVNGRWLWRNRVGAERIDITIRCGQETLHFSDAKQYSIHHFDTQHADIDTLTSWIMAGLSDPKLTVLYLEAHVVVGYGQQVFPSQELILKDKKEKDKKSKILYQIKGKAGMHAQKIGNALRTIDTWYPQAEFPIAIEPYGAVTSMGEAFRQPTEKVDFYTLLDRWILKGETLALEEQHYVIAVLIRGGVFGESGKES